jgi:hypothetical protein
MVSNAGDNDSFKLEVRRSLADIVDRAEQLSKIIAYVSRVTALCAGKKEENLQPDEPFASLGVTEETAVEMRNQIANELSLFLSKGMFKDAHTIRSVAEYVQEALLSAK